MIVFGTTNLTFKKDTGSFLCPTCGNNQPYVEKNVRRFFTFYFIPIVPLDSVGRYIECQSCVQSFDPEVLLLDEEAIMQARYVQFVEHCRRLMILMMIADADVKPAAKQVVNATIAELGGSPYSDEELDESLAMAFEADINVAEYAAQIAPRLEPEQKREIVKAVFRVASVDGEMGEMQAELLQLLPDAMEFDEGDFREAIVEVAEE